MIDTQITPSYIFGVFLAYALFSILIFIPSTVIYWKLFKKAGHEGWRYIIPVDGQYTMGLIAGSPKLGLATGIIWAVYYIQALARTFYIGIPQSVVFTVGILWIVTSLVLLGKFIQKFDAGIGRWIVFVFFPLIGMFFVKSVKYKGAVDGPVTDAPDTPEQTQTAPAVALPWPSEWRRIPTRRIDGRSPY